MSYLPCYQHLIKWSVQFWIGKLVFEVGIFMETNYKLAVLTRLRDDAGLTQSDAAKYFSVSRNAIQAWENGSSIPRQNRRLEFQYYLADKLKLKTKPKEYLDVWQLLMSEWNWENITDEEWQHIFNTKKPDIVAQSEIDELLSMSETALNQRDYAHAHHCFTKILHLDKTHVAANKGRIEALNRWGYQALSMCLYDQANHYFTMALGYDSNVEEVKLGKISTLLQWGIQLISSGNLTEGKRRFTEVLMYAPNHEEAINRIKQVNEMQSML